MDEKYVVYVMDLGLVYGPFDSEDEANKFVNDNEIDESEITELVSPNDY